MLQTNRYAVRMASFLSSRALSSDELSTLSGVSQTDCEQFIDTLVNAGLLREGAADAPTPSPAAAPAEAPAPRPSRNLLANLRAKLGIRSA